MDTYRWSMQAVRPGRPQHYRINPGATHHSAWSLDDDLGQLQKIMLSMMSDSALSDVCLVVESIDVPAHKAVLAAWSRPFRAMFTLPMLESRHKCRVVIEDAKHKHLMVVVQYLYSGRIGLNDQNVMPVSALANRYEIVPLMGQCEGYMKWRLNPNNVCRHLLAAEDHQCASMAAFALDYLAVHFDEVHHESSCEFNALGPDTVMRVLQHEGLTVDEETVFLAVDGWAKTWRLRRAMRGSSSPGGRSTPSPPAPSVDVRRHEIQALSAACESGDRIPDRGHSPVAASTTRDSAGASDGGQATGTNVGGTGTDEGGSREPEVVASKQSPPRSGDDHLGAVAGAASAASDGGVGVRNRGGEGAAGRDVGGVGALGSAHTERRPDSAAQGGGPAREQRTHASSRDVLAPAAADERSSGEGAVPEGGNVGASVKQRSRTVDEIAPEDVAPSGAPKGGVSGGREGKGEGDSAPANAPVAKQGRSRGKKTRGAEKSSSKISTKWTWEGGLTRRHQPNALAGEQGRRADEHWPARPGAAASSTGAVTRRDGAGDGASDAGESAASGSSAATRGEQEELDVLPAEERAIVDELLEEVRFPLISTIFLCQVVEKSPAVAGSRVAQRLLHEAYRFQAIRPDSGHVDEHFPGNHRVKFRGHERVLFGEGDGCVGTVDDYSSSLSEVHLVENVQRRDEKYWLPGQPEEAYVCIRLDRVRRITKFRFQNRYSEEFELSVRRTTREEWQVIVLRQPSGGHKDVKELDLTRKRVKARHVKISLRGRKRSCYNTSVYWTELLGF